MPRQTTPNDDGTDSTATDQALADELDNDIGGDGTDINELQSLVTALEDETPPPVSSVLETLVTTINDLQERVSDLEGDVEQTHDVSTTAVGNAATNDQRLEEMEAQQEATHDVAKSAIAEAQQLEADTDHQKTPSSCPRGSNPAARR